MCLILIAWRTPGIPLVIAAKRDEYYNGHGQGVLRTIRHPRRMT
jgi:uncharacterized protein with NRDE domain